MPFLWLKSSVASHISLENYKSLNRAYRVLTWCGSSDGTTLPRTLDDLVILACSPGPFFLQADVQAVPLPSVVTWLAHHHHSGLEISATASGRPSQLCTFLISCTFPLQHILQTVVTIYVDSCDCSDSFLPANSFSSTKEGLNLLRSALGTHHRGHGYSINIC